MQHLPSERLQADAAAAIVADGNRAPSGHAVEPPVARVVGVFLGVACIVVALFEMAHLLAAFVSTSAGLLASLAIGAIAALLVGSLAEWAVHRWIMHRPSSLPGLRLAYEHHHRAHHWMNFPPDQYIQAGNVQYVPLWTERLDRVATTRLTWVVTVAAHLAFYSVFAVALVVLPAWLWSGNAAFAWSVTATTVVVLFLFIHAHDAMHYPGLSPIERFAFFRWLDHHHYIHHIDTRANTNFLLPLGDLLLGTLRRTLTPEELRRWPTYEEARRRLVTPAFAPDGTRLGAFSDR